MRLLPLVLASALAAGCSAQGAAPADEAAFIDVPPRSDAPYEARLFYVFRAADAGVQRPALVVFFNGGPGFPTSLGLLARGTSRVSIDPVTGQLVTNPASWTSFANLLYVDERQSGFSYGLGAGSNACTFDPLADAADFVRALLGFFDAHESLRKSPVVLVGESYGGMRATYALGLLLRYATEAPQVDGDLAAEIQAHYDKVFPDRAGTVIDEATAATQFGREILLEPFLLGRAQIDTQASTIANDPYVGVVDTSKDPYDIRQPIGWADGITDAIASALAAPGGCERLLGEDPSRIGDMPAAARAGAFRTPSLVADRPAVVSLDASLAARLGALGPDDAYVHAMATPCADVSAPFASPLGALDDLVANAAHVKTFITRARYDATIYTPAIFTVLAQQGFSQVGDGMHLASYDDSGHMIAQAQPRALHDDVAAWLASP